MWYQWNENFDHFFVNGLYSIRTFTDRYTLIKADDKIESTSLLISC